MTMSRAHLKYKLKIMRKHPKTLWLIGCLAIVLTGVLVLGAGCVWPAGKNGTSIRPANEASEEESSGEETTVTPTLTPTSTATVTATPVPTTTSSTCTLTKPSFGSSDAFHQVLMKYFGFIDDKDYDSAFGMLAEDAVSYYSTTGISTYQNYINFFKENVACIQVTKITSVTDLQKCPMMSASLGIECYQVELEYYPPAGAASPKAVPTIYTVHSDPHQGGDPVENAEITNIQD
jgi:hypothetical protein